MAATYNPPKLPDYIADVFDLKPVVGVPTDAEVQLIHSVIRVVKNTSHSRYISQ